MMRHQERGSIARAATRAIGVTVVFGLVASAIGIVFSLQAEGASDKALTIVLILVGLATLIVMSFDG